jgi:hypothetical protein
MTQKRTPLTIAVGDGRRRVPLLQKLFNLVWCRRPVFGVDLIGFVENITLQE